VDDGDHRGSLTDRERAIVSGRIAPATERDATWLIGV
jgi:hypothetical protein